jgi:hypothetical protein
MKTNERADAVSRRLLAGFLALALGAGAIAAEPVVTKTTWREIEAWQITDGRAVAVVVPKLGGRVMVFGLVGGTNFIWSGEPGAETKPITQMWGGEKTYIGPHSMWGFTQPRTWPPPAPDAAEHLAEVLEGGRLRTVSPPWESYGGARITREYGFDAKGDFVMTHTISKVPGSRQIGAVWVIAQTIPSDCVFVPLNPQSPYKDNFFWFNFGGPKDRKGAQPLSASMLKIQPVTGEGFKLGANPKQPALATIKDGIAFVQRADPQDGQYPEGADGAGLSVEVYHHDLPGPGEYTELEFLSPLRRLDAGATLTTRWTLVGFPDEQPHGEAKAAEKLLDR